jgi:hypothetical protein
LNTAEATHNARYFELLQSLRPMIAPRVSLTDLAGDYSSEEFSGRMQKRARGDRECDRRGRCQERTGRHAAPL